MTTASSCPRCGAVLATGSRLGQCPACLLAGALSAVDGSPVEDEVVEASGTNEADEAPLGIDHPPPLPSPVARVPSPAATAPSQAGWTVAVLLALGMGVGIEVVQARYTGGPGPSADRPWERGYLHGWWRGDNAPDQRRGHPPHAIQAGGARALAFSSDGKRLAALDGEGGGEIWWVATGAVAARLQRVPGGRRSGGPDLASLASSRVDFSQENALVAGPAGDGIAVWRARDGALRRVLPAPSGRLLRVRFDENGRLHMVHRPPDGAVPEEHTWDVATGAHLSQVAQRGPLDEGPSPTAPTPDGADVIVGGADGSVHLRDAATGARRPIALAPHSGRVVSIALALDGQLVATAGEEGVIHLERSTWFDEVRPHAQPPSSPGSAPGSVPGSVVGRVGLRVRQMVGWPLLLGAIAWLGLARRRDGRLLLRVQGRAARAGGRWIRLAAALCLINLLLDALLVVLVLAGAGLSLIAAYSVGGRSLSMAPLRFLDLYLATLWPLAGLGAVVASRVVSRVGAALLLWRIASRVELRERGIRCRGRLFPWSGVTLFAGRGEPPAIGMAAPGRARTVEVRLTGGERAAIEEMVHARMNG